MDDRWITGKHASGQVTFERHFIEAVPLRVYDQLWEHTCLELDPKAMVARERDQGSNPSDNPDDWEAVEEFALRRVERSWQIDVPAAEHQRWVSEWTSHIARTEEYLRAGRISPRAAQWLLADARSALEVLAKQGPGWMDLDPAIAEQIFRYLAER